MKTRFAMLMVMISALPVVANAVQPAMQVVYRYVTVPKKPPAQIAAGLINTDQSTTEGCSRRFGRIKVEGVQFSSSGATLESFRFTDASGNQWSIPTDITRLPNAERSAANNFIRAGKSYFLDVEACGSGGYPSLISMFDANVSFGQ
ncbi:hypothetical protein AWB75_06004 [Caballeronia catudaia]|uniref:Secreted protein n=1 Tax=Caballeronia catudaia TaxID=1777136 RepID=A0A158CZZ2_9BURK|nr:hypothetical protein [Caballeronia catudaia]SAK87942.1 hypothetical protein AWB75_06004 [Caballeronia catudaia]